VVLVRESWQEWPAQAMQETLHDDSVHPAIGARLQPGPPPGPPPQNLLFEASTGTGASSSSGGGDLHKEARVVVVVAVSRVTLRCGSCH
jgi:hypothetical protein